MGARDDLSLPFTSLLMSALSCGISMERAARMTYPELCMSVRARNETRGDSDDGRSDGVRDATQADIRAFVG